MDNRAQEILTEAYNRNAVHGVFVHFSKGYFRENIRNAFATAGELLNGLRERNIPPIHILDDTRICAKGEVELSSIKNTLDKNDHPHELIQPIANEKIFAYYSSDGLENDKAADYFRSLERPVFIYGGVYALDCFANTIAGTLERVKDAQIIIATDATNDQPNIDEYLAQLETYLEKDEHKTRLHGSTTPQILSAINLTLNDFD